MIKGAQKQMIVVRTAGSHYFEEAYFVLKSTLRPQRGKRNDLLAEADRIIRESENARSGKQPRRRFSPGWFLLGCAAGCALGILVCLLF